MSITYYSKLTYFSVEFPASMGDSSYGLNFDLRKKNEIHHHRKKERLRMSKTAKIGC
jgi:hypothetical protein